VKNKNESLSPSSLHIQGLLRPDLTPVLRNRDYFRMLEDLTKLDQDLRTSGLESLAMSLAVESMGDGVSFSQQNRRCEFAIYSLRAELLRHMLGTPSFESYSVTLSTSDLFNDFCRCRSIDGIRWTSKSTLHRASTFFNDEQLRKLNTLLIETLGGAYDEKPLGLEAPEDLSVYLIDSTCLKANIHFPVDWVLLRDVSITLLKATRLIRKEGLRHRIPYESEKFIREMNKLSIEMTHARRRKGAAKERKKVLRKMKKRLRRIGKHAKHHRDLLDKKLDQTMLSRAQADRIILRIDEKLDLLPQVIDQAHKRIIGERQVKNEDKILSAHERDIDVIVRGKAGAQVEFGNELFLAESKRGLIFDYKLYARSAPVKGQRCKRVSSAWKD
jgi:hypothetical protein